MRHVEVCFCASTDQESSFHHCGDLVKLVQACFFVRKTPHNADLTAVVVL